MPYQKVIWRDGQPINAGYLQQQTQYFETLIQHQNPNIYNWGFWQLEFDSDKLSQREITLTKGRGIFPDGTLFDINDLPKPLSVQLTDLEITAPTKVYLGIPVSNEQQQQIDFNSENQNNLFRYQVVPYSCQDITHSEKTRPALELKIAIANIHILLETDLETKNVQWMALPIAKIIKLDNGQIVFDETYWAPTLNSFSESSAGKQLTQLLTDTLNKLAQFNSHLQAKLTNKSSHAFTVNHFLLHVVNKYQALLKHLATLPQVHPEQFFRGLLSLVTDLTGLAAEYPEVRYQHDDISNGFTQLYQRLVSFVEQQIDQQDYLILTSAGKPYSGVAQFKSLEKLAITPNDQLILEIEQHFGVLIVAPDESIQNLYLGGFDGIPLRQLNQLPDQLRQRQGYQYYQLDDTNHLNNDYLSIYIDDQQQLGQNHEITLWFA